MGSITEGVQHIGDSVLKAKIAKYEEQKDKAKEQLEATSINSAIMEMVGSQSPEESDQTSKVLEAIGNKSPEASKIVFNNIQSRIKDKIDFSQTLQLEKYKAGTAAITEVVKSMAEKGGYTPEQLQAIQAESANRVYQSLGIGDIAQRINQLGQQPQPYSQTQGSDFFSKPIVAKKTEKQIDYDQTLERGLQILDETEKQYNLISEKYGTGRLKGVATGIQGKLGDLNPLIGSKEAPEVVPYMNNLEGLANFIGKSVYRDERVSDVNIKGYRKALADLTNTPEEAKIMFGTLRSYATGRSIQDEIALRYMIPKDGKAMKPSEAVKFATGKNPFSKLSREDKISLLKKKKQNG